MDLPEEHHVQGCPLVEHAGFVCLFLVQELGWRLGPSARRWPGAVGFPLAAVVTFFAATAAGGSAAAWLLSLSAGLGAAGVAPAWPVCVEVGRARAGVLSGAMNMCGNLGGTLCPIVVGMCVKRLGSWSVALDLVAVAYLVAGAAWLAVDLRVPAGGDARA